MDSNVGFNIDEYIFYADNNIFSFKECFLVAIPNYKKNKIADNSNRVFKYYIYSNNTDIIPIEEYLI